MTSCFYCVCLTPYVVCIAALGKFNRRKPITLPCVLCILPADFAVIPVRVACLTPCSVCCDVVRDYVDSIQSNIPIRLLNKMLSYRRETALQGALVLAKSGRLELRGETISYGHYRSIFNQCDIIGYKAIGFGEKMQN